MANLTRRAALAAAATLALTLNSGISFAADKTLVVGYQTVVEPSKVAQAAGGYEKATGWKIDWRKFDSGADVIAAIASGDVQIGYVGSSPLAAAATREVPFQTIFIAGIIGESEALVVSNKSGIKKPEDLAGKKIAVPFVSTTHYSLLAALKHWKVDPKSVEILNLRPPEIVAAWERGDIDGAYVWDPALGKAKESGSVLISSKEVAGFGAPTFDAWIAHNDLIEKNPDVVKAFVKVTGKAYADYAADPKAWGTDSAQAKDIARLTGAKVEEVPALLTGYHLPSLSEQASPELLGGGTVKAVSDAAAFLKEQGKVPAVLPDYSAYVTKRFVVEATASR